MHFGAMKTFINMPLTLELCLSSNKPKPRGFVTALTKNKLDKENYFVAKG